MYVLSENKSLRELSEILGCENVQIDTKIERIIFDSKIAREGDLFIPLKGNNHDAEDFIEEVLQKGASVITKQKIFGKSIVVDDVYNSLLDICANKLTESKAKVIFITGSYGKTTLKDMLKSLLGDNVMQAKIMKITNLVFLSPYLACQKIQNILWLNVVQEMLGF